MKIRMGFVSNSSSSSFIIFIISVDTNVLKRFTLFYKHVFKIDIDDEIDFERMRFGITLFKQIYDLKSQSIKDRIKGLFRNDIFVDHFLTFDKLFKEKSNDEIIEFLSNLKSMNHISKDIISERVENNIYGNFYDFIEKFKFFYGQEININIEEIIVEVVLHFYKEYFEKYESFEIDINNADYEMYEVNKFLKSYDKDYIFF